MPSIYKLVFLLLALVATAHADPCTSEDYAEAHYGECCAQGNYKKDGHSDICKTVGPKVKARKEL